MATSSAAQQAARAGQNSATSWHSPKEPPTASTLGEILSTIEGISAVTLATHEMSRAVRFYRALGLEVCMVAKSRHLPAFEQGRAISTSSHSQLSGAGHVGCVIFYVADVDTLYDRALAAGYQSASAPRDAE
jgi:hypothetical protein